MSNPISALQEFYQRLHMPPSSIEYTTSTYCLDRPEQAEQRFVCSVKLPAVVLGDEGGVVRQVLSEEVFQGEGRKKADAKRDAAAAALVYLHQQPLWQQLQQQRQAPLQDVLAACLTNQGIIKDAELRAHWTYCQQYPLAHPAQQQQQQQRQQDEPAAAAAAQAGASREVLLPLTALAHSKQLLQWLRQQHKQQQQQQQQQEQGGTSTPLPPAAAAAEAEIKAPPASIPFDEGDVPGVMRSIRQLLQEQAAAGMLPPGVCLVAGGMGVSWQQVLHAAGGDRGVSHHQHQHHHAAAAALAHEVWQQQPVLVEVPVDVR
ncbi:hypothetical protein OEZ86_005243 [Tetradesmus obliquus]|nr:hypothetical protein OEZ86_005243 [Tetradesmus obliquus]